MRDRFIPTYKNPSSLQKHKHHTPSTAYSHYMSPEATGVLQYRPVETKCPTIRQFLQSALQQSQTHKHLKSPLPHMIKAEDILDAPDALDHPNYDVLHWGQDRISLGLGENVYLVKDSSACVQKLHRFAASMITCVRAYDQLVFLGCENGKMELFDWAHNCKVRNMQLSKQPLTCMEPITNHLYASAGNDHLITLFDVRLKNSLLQQLPKHQATVCSLTCQNSYLASVGMDENVYVWDMRRSGCVAERKGRAQGKGLSWCPWKANVLAYSNKDKGVSLFNTYDGEEVQRVGGVGAHIPYIGWLAEQKIMLATISLQKGKSWVGGFKEEGEFRQWLKIKGHMGRILGLGVRPSSPYQCCTLGEDETLKFYNIPPQYLH